MFVRGDLNKCYRAIAGGNWNCGLLSPFVAGKIKHGLQGNEIFWL
jgi:hypothetical protein